MKKRTKALFSALIVLLIIGCEPSLENPFDPDNPDYVDPETTLVSSINDGDLINTSSIVMNWDGNDLSIEYSYKFDDNNWSDWTENTSVEINYIDEGEHQFSVKSRYENQIEDQSPAELSFTVDAVQGPALRIYPLYSEIQSGQSSSVEIYLEEVDHVRGIEIELNYDPTVVSFQGYNEDDLLNQFNGEVVVINENQSGSVSITLATIFGDSNGLSGTGSILELSLLGLSPGSTFFEFSSIVFKDSLNNSITVNDYENGVVVVK